MTVDLARLARALNGEGLDALERYAREVLVPRVIADIPVGDPEQDPDPSVNLAERTAVERDGNIVRIVVDAEHAVVQHYAGYLHPRGGKQRFLEDNVQAAAGFIENELAGAIRRRLEREGGRP